jgi:glycosyltransferase involved in cell wall biosynthesis
VKVIHHAFSPEKWKDAESIDREVLRTSFGLRGVVFANISRMHEEKGHIYLLRGIALARQRIPGLEVLLIGDGPLRGSIEKEIGRLEIRDCVKILGWRKDALEIMAAVDVVLHPTLHEAFSQTMIEALYLRKPLVITPVSGAVDVIEDEVNGLLIPARDPDAIAAAMQRLAADGSLRRRLGEAGRSFVERNLSVGKIIPEYENLYRTLAGSLAETRPKGAGTFAL